jgi:hypothetical protein
MFAAGFIALATGAQKNPSIMPTFCRELNFMMPGVSF